jgi:hypothetical protein
MIKYLYFAIPSKLAKYIEYIPKHAGVIIIRSPRERIWQGRVFKIAKAEPNKNCRRLTDDEIMHVLHLGNMRTWLLREKLLNLQLDKNE